MARKHFLYGADSILEERAGRTIHADANAFLPSARSSAKCASAAGATPDGCYDVLLADLYDGSNPIEWLSQRCGAAIRCPVVDFIQPILILLTRDQIRVTARCCA